MKALRRLISRQRKAQPGDSGFTLQWHITHQCDHRCSHCYQDRFDATDLPADQLREVAEQFSSFLAAQQKQRWDRSVSGQLTITGGEPLLHHDIRLLLITLHADYPHIHKAILSNGSLIDAEAARWLAGFNPDFVQLSLEGAEATHDAIRGAGDYQRVISALQHLKAAGVRTMASFTAHRGNFREFAAVAEAARKCGVKRVWSDRCLPIGASLQGDAVLSQNETREFFESMHAVRKSAGGKFFGKTEIAMHRALQFLVAGGKPYSCQAGRSLLAVMPNGDIYPCRRMPVHIGNLLEHSLETVWHESPLLKKLRSKASIPEACMCCFYAKACRGGLKCLSYAVTGDPFAKDPGCWHPDGRSDTKQF